MIIIKCYIIRDWGVCWNNIESSILTPISILKKYVCIRNKRFDALVMFHMLLIGEHLGPRLTKYMRLQLLLATLMTNCMYLCQCIFSLVEILGGCHLDFYGTWMLQME